MTCSYRIIVCFDGGARSLEVPVISLNYMRERFFAAAGDRFSYDWVDLAVSYGESNVLALLLAASPQTFNRNLMAVSEGFHSGESCVSILLDAIPENTTLRELRKHVLLNYHDKKSGSLQNISTMSPYQEAKRVHDILDQFVRSSTQENKLMELKGSLEFTFNPIQQAVNLAYCLYPEDSLVFISIGSQMRQLSAKITTELDHFQVREQLREDKKAHYFRIAPPFEPNLNYVENKARIESFLDQELPSVERLFRLMEIKSGRLL